MLEWEEALRASRGRLITLFDELESIVYPHMVETEYSKEELEVVAFLSNQLSYLNYVINSRLKV